MMIQVMAVEREEAKDFVEKEQTSRDIDQLKTPV